MRTMSDLWNEVADAADHIVWEPQTRESVRLVMVYLVDTLELAGAWDEQGDTFSLGGWSFDALVACLLAGMERDSHRGIRRWVRR